MIYCSVVVVVVVVNGEGFQCQFNAFSGSSGPSAISLPPADTTTPFRSGRGSCRYCSGERFQCHCGSYQDATAVFGEG